MGVTWLTSLAHQRPGLQGSVVFLAVSKHVAKRRVLLLQPFKYSPVFCIIQIEMFSKRKKKSLACFKFFSKARVSHIISQELCRFRDSNGTG